MKLLSITSVARPHDDVIAIPPSRLSARQLISFLLTVGPIYRQPAPRSHTCLFLSVIPPDHPEACRSNPNISGGRPDSVITSSDLPIFLI